MLFICVEQMPLLLVARGRGTLEISTNRKTVTRWGESAQKLAFTAEHTRGLPSSKPPHLNGVRRLRPKGTPRKHDSKGFTKPTAT